MIEFVDWDFATQFEVVAHNAFGDLFRRSTESDAVYYLWTQLGRARRAAGDAQELFESLLMDARNRAKFLEAGAFGVVSQRLGPLRYGTVFTLNPIRALGGDGDLGNCEVGLPSVYLSIISQSLEPG
jgi:hypothetical protein